MKDKELLEIAEKARANSYSPYSGFSVGAALLTEESKVFTGCNIENSSLGLTCCAERVALFKAVSEGEKNFLKLAISGEGKKAIFPCGACLQALFEFAPNLIIITLKGDEIQRVSLRELLPAGFSLQEKDRHLN
jgi:cytidine deaminase